MQAGTLNKRVKIQHLVAGQDAIGQPVQTWSDVATVWASLRYLNGVEAIKATADVSMAKVSVRIRYRADITPGMRVLHGTIAMDIEAVLPDETGKVHVDLACVVVS